MSAQYITPNKDKVKKAHLEVFMKGNVIGSGFRAWRTRPAAAAAPPTRRCRRGSSSP